MDQHLNEDKKRNFVNRKIAFVPAVGSSKITVVEFPMNAIAMESFLFIPPDNSVE